MKKGDFFAVGVKGSREASLLCELREIKGGVLHGHVTHGAWDFTLSGTRLVVERTGEVLDREIVWAGKIPKGVYDELEYAQRRAGYWWIVNCVVDSCIVVSREWERFVRAIGAAKRAFGVVYKANSRFVQDEDDTIPF